MNVSDIGNNIRRLMKLKGLSIANLASKMDIGTATLSNILNGKSEPRSSTLIKLSDALGASINDLLSESPKLKSLRFRTSKSLSAREKAKRDQLLVSTAQWLNDYKELEDMLGKTSVFKFKKLKSRTPCKIAIEARNLIDLPNPKEPIYDIANLIEKAGIKLNICNFGFKKTFGLSVSENDKGPAIIVNSEAGISIERQIFTIVHELGHLLLHSNSYGKEEDEDKIKKEENEANIFAGQFLLPDDALLAEWDEAQGLHWVDAVLKIKKIYKISYKTVLVRLSQLAEGAKLPDIIKRFSIDYKFKYKHDLKNYYEPDALEDPVADDDPKALCEHDLVEDRFAKLVRIAFEKELISISRAGELLHKDTMEMRELVKSWQEYSLNAKP